MDHELNLNKGKKTAIHPCVISSYHNSCTADQRTTCSTPLAHYRNNTSTKIKMYEWLHYIYMVVPYQSLKTETRTEGCHKILIDGLILAQFSSLSTILPCQSRWRWRPAPLTTSYSNSSTSFSSSKPCRLLSEPPSTSSLGSPNSRVRPQAITFFFLNNF